MTLYKIHDRLYRLKTKDYIKDVTLYNGKITLPKNPFNALTDTERKFVEQELIKL